MERRKFLSLLAGAFVAATINIRLKEPLEIEQVNPLGLRTHLYDSYDVSNFRRRLFYQYPNGAAPLTGLLSMIKE